MTLIGERERVSHDTHTHTLVPEDLFEVPKDSKHYVVTRERRVSTMWLWCVCVCGCRQRCINALKSTAHQHCHRSVCVCVPLLSPYPPMQTNIPAHNHTHALCNPAQPMDFLERLLDIYLMNRSTSSFICNSFIQKSRSAQIDFK